MYIKLLQYPVFYYFIFFILSCSFIVFFLILFPFPSEENQASEYIFSGAERRNTHEFFFYISFYLLERKKEFIFIELNSIQY